MMPTHRDSHGINVELHCKWRKVDVKGIFQGFLWYVREELFEV